MIWALFLIVILFLAVVPQSENNLGINPQNGFGINPQTGLGINPHVSPIDMRINAQTGHFDILRTSAQTFSNRGTKPKLI